MGLFDFLKRNRDYELYDDDTDEEIDDEEFEEESESDDLVERTFESIVAKCDDGDRMDTLNSHERILYITQTLEQEINNGGFSQFFYNSPGDFANEVVEAFTAIGANKTAAICQKALSRFRGSVPTDRIERQKQLDRMHCEKLWEKCDDQFYEYEDDLESLNRTYILNHPDSFQP